MRKESDFSFNEDNRSYPTSYFSLKGRISVTEAAIMENKLEKVRSAGYTHIVINMGAVNFFSSAAIRVILATHKKLRAAGGKLQITAPSECVRNVIGMTGLDEFMAK